MSVGDDVFFDKGFTAHGSVRLDDARITGQLVCSSAHLETARGDDCSLSGERMNAGGSVFLDQGFTASGAVSFQSARVGGSLRIMPEQFAEGSDRIAFDGSGIKVSSTLLWKPSSPISGLVSLQGAIADELEDDWTAGRPNGYWPINGRLLLNGFIYARIDGDNQATVKQRLSWIRSQYEYLGSQPVTLMPTPFFTVQPYSQLEKVYRATGQQSQATRVAMALRRDMRRYAYLNWYARFGNWLLDKTIGYGYQPWRALVVLGVVYIVVVMITLIALQHAGAIVPVPQNAIGINATLSAKHCTSNYPCFSASGYAFDTVVPVINLHATEYWRPNPANRWGFVLQLISSLGAIYGWALALLVGGGSARVLAVLGGTPPPGQDSSLS